jgi:hypothetical protein
MNGLAAVQAERDSNNSPSQDTAPPVMPAELVRIRPGKFISEVLDPYRDQISQFWSADDIDLIEKDHRDMIGVYNMSNSWLKLAISKHNHSVSFNDAWDDLKGQYKYLRAFVGGLATAFANTTSVESDFSILKWEKDSNRTALTSLALEGVFQAKQHDILAKI